MTITTQSKEKDVHVVPFPGDLRDWFAGQALAGILAGPASRDNVPTSEWLDAPHFAYKIADAMLAARSQS